MRGFMDRTQTEQREEFILQGGPWLFVDAAGAVPVAGWWRDGCWEAFRQVEGAQTLEGFFTAVEAVLQEAGARLADARGVVFVEGPGSILGIRVAAMAVRAWRTLPGLAEWPVWGVGTLALAGSLLRRECPELADFSLLADSRQGRWNVAVVRGGKVPEGFGETRAEELAELPAPCFRITQRALGAPPVACAAYPGGLLEKYPDVLAAPGLLRRVEEPDAVNMPGVFAKWEAGRHRGV